MIEWVIIIGVLVALVGFIGFSFWEVSQYKIMFRRKILSGGKFLIMDDKARLVRRGKDERWKLQKCKLIVPVAPPEFTELGANGKVHVTAYWDGSQHFYSRDETNSKKIKDKYEIELGDYDTFTSQDKDFYANNMKESLTYGRNQFWEKYGTPIVIGSILIVFFVIFATMIGEPLTYIKESGAEWKEASNNFRVASSSLDNATTQLYKLLGDEQLIPGK